MAGKPIGTCFVELDLDASKFSKKQREIYNDATNTALGVEKSWRIIGQQSDVMYDVMRQRIARAYDQIKNSATSTQQEIVRAEQAAKDKIKHIDEQQYGHQVGLIEKIKANWLGMTAAIVAAWMAVQRAVAYMDLGAQAQQIGSAFKIIAESSGANADAMIANMKRVTKGTIDESDMQAKAIKLMLLEYNPEQIVRFSKVASTAAIYGATTVANAYEQLADAIANRTPKALVRLGAVTREQMKIVNKAIEGGADTMVLYELAMANLELKQLQLQGTQDNATLALQRFHAEMNDAKETIGIGFNVAVQTAWRLMEGLAGGIMGAYGALLKFEGGIFSGIISKTPGAFIAKNLFGFDIKAMGEQMKTLGAEFTGTRNQIYDELSVDDRVGRAGRPIEGVLDGYLAVW